MFATMSSRGRITIPQKIRDAFGMMPGCEIQFGINRDGEVVVRKVEGCINHKPDRFEAARGKADIKWRTGDLMALLHGDD